MSLLVHSKRRVHWTVLITATIFALSLAQSVHATSSLPSSTTTGVIIPLYTYPGSTWAVVIQAKEANPGVNIVAVINPDNGPGASKDQNYVNGIQALRSAGVTVLGYVHTSYASRPAASVIADINSYKSWYNVSGIFLDEMSNVAGNEGYYSSLNTYIKSLGYTMTVGNPGADTIPGYIGTVDVIVIYENAGLPSPSSVTGWHSSYAKSNFASISYGVDAVNQTYITSISNSVGYIYLTSGDLPNPYGALPSYLGGLVAALGVQPASNIQSQTTTTTATTSSSTNTSSTASATISSSTNSTMAASTTSTSTVSNSSTTTSITSSSSATSTATTSATSTTTAVSSPISSSTTSSSTTSTTALSSTTSPVTTATATPSPIGTTAISQPTVSNTTLTTNGPITILHSVIIGFLGFLSYLRREIIMGARVILSILRL
jgi:hypothetical protein